MALGCDRCGASTPAYGRETEDSVRLLEMQPAFGATALLCIECRKVWYRTLHTHPVFKAYQEAMFEMDFWRNEHRKHGRGTLKDGQTILTTLTVLEEKGLAVLDGLVRAGLTRAEEQDRKERERERDEFHDTHKYSDDDDNDDDN